MTDAQKLYRLYQKGVDYTLKIGLDTKIKKNVAFYEGDQWAPPTEATRAMPRPVVNVVRFICRNKRAMLTSVPVKLVFSSERNPERARELTDFASYISKKMDLEELDSRAIRDALIKGSYFYHLFWDSSVKNYKGIREGDIRCELIDPRDIFFENPLEQDEQKQGWIIVTSKLTSKMILDIADNKGELDFLEGNSDDDKKYTVITRYFRKNGEVYCERGLENGIINKPFPITPKGAIAKCTLYPIVAGVYEEREKCIYGISEAEALIPNQKLINHVLGMEALAIQNTAWGKYVVTKDALRGQQISNEPGEILVDHSLSGNGIKKLEQHALSSIPLSYINNLANMTRTFCGATEVMTGESFNANLSGAAIAQLQAQANQPINEQRKRYWRVKRKFGRLLEQFFKAYYDNKEWFDGANKKIFTSKDYDSMEFDITVEAVGGSNGTVAGDISLLETLYNKGDITALEFIELYPKDNLCDKQSFVDLLLNRKMSTVLE